MHKIVITLNIIFFLFACNNNSKSQKDKVHKSHEMEDMNSSLKETLSPRKYAMNMIGDAHIHIDYSSPSVRGRIIFGGLLVMGEVWQSGAHYATWLETNKDLLIENNLIKAGKYGFFTIPNKDNWTVILNKNWKQHGKDEYDEKDDVLRFKVKPKFSEEITEQLIYRVKKINGSQGTVSLSWEKTTISFPFSISR